MFFKKKNYDYAEQISKLEQSVEYWKEQFYIHKEYSDFLSVELDNTKKELDKYTMLYHDALSHLRQVMEATNYGKER